MADETTPSPLLTAVEEPVHKSAKALSDRSNPELSLVPVSNETVVSQQGPTIEPPKTSLPKRKKGVKGPILL